MKASYLVCYDYQHGGVWAFVLAESRSEFTEKYPELELVDSMPTWMTQDVVDRLRLTMTIDVNDTENPFFAALIKQRAGRTQGQSG
jgi:hypothetical protein